MAITKTFPTTYGIDVNHNVIQEIGISRTSGTLNFSLTRYPAVSNYLTGNTGYIGSTYSFNFGVLPPTLLAKILELKSLIEIEMINNLPEWYGGVQVNDDGTPI